MQTSTRPGLPCGSTFTAVNRRHPAWSPALALGGLAFSSLTDTRRPHLGWERSPWVGETVAASVSRAATAVAGGYSGSPPEGPLLRPQGGAGSRTVWRQGYWLWPLPPPGDLLIACEWPNAGIELTTATVNADVLREAARRAQELSPPQDAPEWPGATAP